ncbi:hypothetical protein B0H17DRAFT_1145495 [Mycena rosella]|uniref:Uncharacterized protein n=1 Tax=Mycena rosella TaxID=1033263 RepID=A0AAD7G4J4_MYCRO|nr:hypothetical protein B0H17DRAFT_1145495 [Mycena rosella]
MAERSSEPASLADDESEELNDKSERSSREFGQFWQWRPQSQIRSSDKGIALIEKVRWKTDSTALTPPVETGNAANAEVTAAGRAKETVKRGRTIFGKLKYLSTVAEGGVGSDSVLENRSYGFVSSGSKIVLARVITMYSKGGDKAGAHSTAHRSESIGALSYLFFLTYEHGF